MATEKTFTLTQINNMGLGFMAGLKEVKIHDELDKQYWSGYLAGIKAFVETAQKLAGEE